MAGRKQRHDGQAPERPPAAIVPITDRDDPRGVPSAQGGWSENIVTLDDALVVPTSGAGMVQQGGVIDDRDRFVDAAVHWRRGRPLLLPPATVPAAQATLRGSWLWGGVLLNHFGHFLTESTPRLWALPELEGQIDGIVFLHKRNGEPTEFHRTFLKLLQCDLPIEVALAPTRVERLHVPGQGFGLGRITIGTPKFRQLFTERFARDIAPEGPERLYISRSALGPKRGGALGESLLEEHLAREGYEIFHPQQNRLETQIARYRAAQRIIALDGSALHLAAFVGSNAQRVAMIRRRSSSMSNAIVIHLKAFMHRAPDVIDAIRADWVLRDRARADRFSLGELDMPGLQRLLARGGFVAPDGPAWPNLDPVWRDAEIDKLRSEFGMDYIAIPRETGPEAGA